MAKLTEAERAEHHAEFMRQLSRTRTVVGAINKFELRALLDAHDDALAAGSTAPLVIPAPTEANFQGNTVAVRRAKKKANDAKLAEVSEWHVRRLEDIKGRAQADPDKAKEPK